ncbi:MAG: TraB/GumN family protein [Bacteroidetes bacterium]|nr:TraB/GumN family protein [Bacteroidota bacterium]
MIQKYLDQDIDGLGILINEEDTKEQFYQEELLNKRNTNWIPKLMKYLDEGSTFAVGAGHLSGTNGVIELLRNKDIRVEPISMD